MLRDKEIFNNPISLDSVKTVVISAVNHTNIIKKINRTNWVVETIENKTDLQKAYNDFSTLSLIKASGFVYNVSLRIDRLFRTPDAIVILYFEDNTKIIYQLVYDIDNKVYVKPESGIIYEVDYSVYDASMRGIEYYIKSEEDLDTEEI